MRKRFKRAVGRASRLGGGGGCIVGGPCQRPSAAGWPYTTDGVWNSNCVCVAGDFEYKTARAGRMVGATGRRDLGGFVGTENSTFVSASGCGYSNASGWYRNQSGWTQEQLTNLLIQQGYGVEDLLEVFTQLPPDYFDSAPVGQSSNYGSVNELLDSLAQQDPYTSAYQSGGTSGLLDALAGNDAGSGGGGTGISSFLDSLADPNDISSGEFGGVDSLLDDLAGQSTTYSGPNNEPTFGGTSSGVSMGTGTTGAGAFGGSVPTMSGGGDGMPPPPPPMSGGGDGMPPPPPPMSGGGDGMPPPPRRMKKQPSVRKTGGGTRVKSPFANGRSKALAKKSFMGR